MYYNRIKFKISLDVIDYTKIIQPKIRGNTMDMNKVYAHFLQGNVAAVIDYLKSCQDEEARVMLESYEKRFYGNEVYEIDSKDPWIRQVVSSYYEYFRRVLMKESQEEAEEQLKQELSKLVEGEPSDLDEIEEILETVFKEKGYSFLGGRTTPYRGPYIWKTTRKETFHVDLLGEEEEVNVHFISDFLMLSWMHFATFGKHYAGGWAKPEGLYYVDNEKEPVDTSANKFQTWFLKHEAQHLKDYREFPNLDGRNLEYRAKLIELIYTEEPLEILLKFLVQAKNDKNVHHSYAAYYIIKNFSNKIFDKAYIGDKDIWTELSEELISKTARELFIENTEVLIKLGKETEGVI